MAARQARGIDPTGRLIEAQRYPARETAPQADPQPEMTVAVGRTASEAGVVGSFGLRRCGHERHCAGHGKPLPAARDPCSSFLLASDDTRIWLDAGPGALGALLAHCSIEDLDAVWISHTHADHFSDLAATYYALLFADITRSPLPVYGPPGWADRLGAFLSHHGPSPIERAFEVHEVTDRYQATVGSVQLSAHQVHHDVLCHGLRAHDGSTTIGYSGDTGPCGGLTELAADVDLLISEAGYGVDGTAPDPVHLTAAQAGAVAKDSGAARLLLTHLAGADPERCAAAARQAGATDVIGARAGGVLTIN